MAGSCGDWRTAFFELDLGSLEIAACKVLFGIFNGGSRFPSLSSSADTYEYDGGNN